MAVEYAKLVERDQPVFLAALVSLGSRAPCFKEATGWSYGIHDHKYESGTHSCSREDLTRLRETITGRAESDPHFWSDYLHGATVKGSRLIDTAHSLATLAQSAPGPQELTEGFMALATATRLMAPFLVATPEVRSVLESALIHRIAEETGGGNARERAAQTLAGLQITLDEPEALGEIRSGYHIAAEIGSHAEALDLLRTTSAAIALSRLESDFPELHGRIVRHVEEYGWIRAHGSRFEPLSPRQLVERIQAVLLRWKPEMIRQAAQRRSGVDLEESLGFSPSEALGRLLGVLQDVLTSRWLRPGIHSQAEWIARPFLATIAEVLGCTREQLMFSTSEEIVAALTRQAPLPLPEIDRRIHHGFTVERSGDGLRVSSHETPSRDRDAKEPKVVALTGQSVSLGRAVGPVRIIFWPGEAAGLEVGDVLVTGASTPDLVETVSAFPSRTDAPPGMERVVAIVTDEGGLLSHAAILSREHGIPCVVGTERATSALVDGQVVEVDATRSMGRIIAYDHD